MKAAAQFRANTNDRSGSELDVFKAAVNSFFAI